MNTTENNAWDITDSVYNAWELLNQADRALETFGSSQQDLYSPDELNKYRVHVQHALFTLQGVFQEIAEPLPPKPDPEASRN